MLPAQAYGGAHTTLPQQQQLINQEMEDLIVDPTTIKAYVQPDLNALFDDSDDFEVVAQPRQRVKSSFYNTVVQYANTYCPTGESLSGSFVVTYGSIAIDGIRSLAKKARTAFSNYFYPKPEPTNYTNYYVTHNNYGIDISEGNPLAPEAEVNALELDNKGKWNRVRKKNPSLNKDNKFYNYKYKTEIGLD